MLNHATGDDSCTQVIGVCRNPELGELALADLREEFPKAEVSYKVRRWLRGGWLARAGCMRRQCTCMGIRHCSHPARSTRMQVCNLEMLSEVTALAQELLAPGRHISILVNNAGRCSLHRAPCSLCMLRMQQPLSRLAAAATCCGRGAGTWTRPLPSPRRGSTRRSQ